MSENEKPKAPADNPYLAAKMPSWWKPEYQKAAALSGPGAPEAPPAPTAPPPPPPPPRQLQLNLRLHRQQLSSGAGSAAS
jgi:hypothetical protein